MIPLEKYFILDEILGVELPHPLFENSGSGIGDNFLERSLKQTNIFERRIVSQTLFATNKAKRIFKRHI